jgi:hypothetical protein
VGGLGDLPTREVYNKWLRLLTVLTEPGNAGAVERLELIERVNPPTTQTVRITSPINARDARALDEALTGLHRLRSRETGAHALVTSLLLEWLSEATGQTQCEIITRLALTIDQMLPPDETAT